jgi:S1-C subfamily serine protease
VNAEGKLAGINTRGVARGRAVTIPTITVNRVVEELLEKGHIARPYLGLAMQPVAVPESLRGKLKSESTGGLIIVHVEPPGPADRAGILLGDVLVELQAKSLESLESRGSSSSWANCGQNGLHIPLRFWRMANRKGVQALSEGMGQTNET